MKRFYFGNDDEGDEDEMEDFVPPSPAELIAMTQMESPAKHLMDSAIRVCEKHIAWRFMSPDDKVTMIKKVFKGLSAISQEYEDDAQI